MTTPESWRAHLRPSLASLSIYDMPPADPSVARMHANESPVPWPDHVIEAVGEAIKRVELGRYPDTSGRAVRALLARRHDCDPDRIVLGNGSDEVIAFVITALSGRGGAVVIPAPTFVMYGHVARVLDLPVREVALDEQFGLRPDAMREALRGAAVCFLARPNNPTGNVWNEAVVRSLIDEHPDTVFVVDEAYAAYDPRCSLYAPDAPAQQVHMSTLSKVGGAALRLGYAVAHPDLATAMNKVRHPYNISATTLAIAELLMTRFADEQAQMLAEAMRLGQRLRAILTTLDGGEVLPSGANFMVLRLKPSDRATALWQHLRDHGVWVKNVSKIPALAGCLRISLGTDAELDRLEAALEAWSP